MSGDGTETVPLPEPDVTGYTCACAWITKHCDEFHSGPIHYTRAQVEHYGRECAEAGAQGERAAAVAWLADKRHRWAARSNDSAYARAYADGSADAYEQAAGLIERGEHL